MARKTIDTDSPPAAKRIRATKHPAKPTKRVAIVATHGKFIRATVQQAFTTNRPSLDSVAAAKQVFGKEKGMRWLGMPVEALQYATPISQAETPAGRKQIYDTLSNLLHGAW